MTGQITAIGLDADDTLWHNERAFQLTQNRFASLLAEYADPDHLAERLLEAERRNLDLYGYGAKGFILSMIETAVEVTDARVPARVIRNILEAGRDILSHPIELLPHARETVETLAHDYRIVLITKGDLLDQERKLAQSGLGEMFDGIEIVSDKTAGIYREIFSRHGDGAEHGLMAGNSLRSDVSPMIAAGGWGVFVPHALTWEIEAAPEPTHSRRYRRVAHLGELPRLVVSLAIPQGSGLPAGSCPP